MNDRDRIERLKKRLYSRDRTDRGVDRRSGLQPESYDVQKIWDTEPRAEKIIRKGKRVSPLTLFVSLSLVFFVGSIAFGSFYFFGGKNIVSADNVEIEIQGPTSVGGGDELNLQITVTNKNNTTLELVDMLVEYPEGTRSADNIKTPLPRYRESLGNITSGEKVKKSVRAVLFGEEQTQQQVKITVEYRVAGSNAIFYSEKVYDVTISSAPVSISVRSFDEVISGQEVVFDVVINSNSTGDVDAVVLQAEYPFGFEPISSTPAPSRSNNMWEIGTLTPEERIVFRITGKITGQNDEERVFRFSVGVRDEQNVETLATTYVSAIRSISIKRPFVTADIVLNGEDKNEYVFESGQQIRVDLTWVNNLAQNITDAEIELRLSGDVVDESSVAVQQGFYNSITDTARWTKNTREELASLNPSESGLVTLTFGTKNVSADPSLKNPEIILSVTLRGKRTSDTNVPEEIISTVTKKVKISSNLSLVGQALYFSGPVTNTGPIPPKAEQETTYTVLWTITNSANHISGARVVGTLPEYVRFIGVVSPNTEQVTFNQSTRQVTWNVGEVSQGVGNSVSPREVAFQIGLTPSISQVGQEPVLIHTSSVSGFDQFTETQLTKTINDLTTLLSTDSGFHTGQAEVAP
jgi:hypothetical protein